MKNKQFFLVSVFAILLSIISILVFAKPIFASEAIATVESAWVDNFDNPNLDSRWTWIRENPAYWSLTDNPGFLRLVTRGSLHQITNNMENILLTPVSGIDYRMTTKVTFSPSENFQRAGLIVYEDDDNYIQMGRMYANGNYARIVSEFGGVTTSTTSNDIVSATTVYLRLDKYGNDYYGYYSLDGTAWEFIGQFNLPLSNTSIGLFAGNEPTALETNADFEYFEFIPRTFNKDWVDNFSEPALNNSWSWLNEDPTHWSLTDNPGFMHITTQQGGIFAGAYHNLLVTKAPNQDYRMTTKVSISPQEDFQGAGLIVYGDDDNYIRLSRRFGTNNHVNLRHESNDVIIVNIAYDETATTVYLCITKEEDVYSGYYSLDGDSYTYVGQTSGVLTNPRIGILSESGPSAMEIPSDYDFFELETNVNWLYLPLVIR